MLRIPGATAALPERFRQEANWRLAVASREHCSTQEVVELYGTISWRWNMFTAAMPTNG